MVAVAQWQSTALWMRVLWVRPPSATLDIRLPNYVFRKSFSLIDFLSDMKATLSEQVDIKIYLQIYY